MTPSRYIANFDSSAAMLRGLARFLHGQDFPALGMLTPAKARLLEPVIGGLNALPRAVLDRLYMVGGWSEAIRPHRLRDIRADDISRWVVDHYPRRRYPAAMVGASNGAAMHLCAALGIPWLPQTFLIPVRQTHVEADEPRYAMEAFRDAGRTLLDANPVLQLHHMHDANQDRLMIQGMAYFRVKRRRLGRTYEEFLEHVLPAGATLYVLDCRRTWRTTRVGERHVFQQGAMGGLEEEEYFTGSPRLAEFLRRHGSGRSAWDPPPADGRSPEAEWGFERALLDDIESLARRRRWRVEHVVFEEPEHLSPLVAGLYRSWYTARGTRVARLLGETFIAFDPWWTIRTASVPFWLKFPVERDAAWLGQYLETVEPYDEIGLTLFCHGVESAGWVPAEQWRRLLGAHARRWYFLGVNERVYPRDFASFVRLRPALAALPSARAMPAPLTLDEFRRFVDEHGHRYRVDVGPPGSLPERRRAQDAA